jgi:hypothetical protein
MPERLILAPDARCVCAARSRSGLGGARLAACAGAALPRGALVPSAAERNVVRASDVRDALADLLSRVAPRMHRADLILPAGAAHLRLLEAGERALGSDELRLRLASGLPFPVQDAVLGAMRVGTSRWLAAAVRRSVVEEYEALASSVGLRPRRVELASLVAITGLLRQPLPEGGIDVVLGDTTVALAVWNRGGLAHLHTRLRGDSEDDTPWLWEEIARTAVAAGHGTVPGVRAAGRGADELVRRAVAHGHAATLAWSLPLSDQGIQAAELSWLGGVLR